MEEMDLRAQVVSETLRFLAGGWVWGEDNQKWLAEVVERMQLDVPLADSTCCPLCEEMTCDSHCPLAPVRSAATRAG